MSVRPPADRSELCEIVVAAAVNQGMPRNHDFNGEKQDGVGYYDLTTRRGRRSNSAIGALRAARRSGNPEVQVNALVHSVDIQSGRANGVWFRGPAGKLQLAVAKREVILCSGAVNTPQLLMLSGIGPKDQLEQHGIPVIVAAEEVGRNLQDHIAVPLTFKTRRRITLNDDMRSWWKRAGMGLNYALFRKGPLTYAAGRVGFFYKSRDHLDRVDAQAFMSPMSTAGYGHGLHTFSAFAMMVTQSWPSSRGEIVLRDRDPSSAPVIRANYLTAEEDMEFFLAALKRLRALASVEPLQAEISEEFLPGSPVQTDSQLAAHIRETVRSCFHPCGTARMGSDPSSVVDAQLQVRGLRGLRVADASVMPKIVSGNINAACLMIAEKAADLILSAHPPE